MNWTIKGITGNGKAATLSVIGGADKPAAVIAALKGSHPDFTPDELTNSTGRRHTVRPIRTKPKATNGS